MASCNYTWDTPVDTLGAYLICILGNMWSILTIVLVSITIIIISILVVRTILSRDNSKELASVVKQWQYVLILAIVVIGGAGSFLNIIFGFLGLPSISDWLEIINDLFSTL